MTAISRRKGLPSCFSDSTHAIAACPCVWKLYHKGDSATPCLLLVIIYATNSRCFAGAAMDDDRREQYEEQTEEIYAAIGRFTVKFEHVCHAMHSGIFMMLSFAGLRNQSIGQAVLADLTAERLRKMFAAVLAENLQRSA